MEYCKADEHTLEVRKTIPEEIIPERVEATHYDLTVLKQEKIRADQVLKTAQADVDRIDALLVEAEKLKLVEEIPVDEAVIS